MNAAPPETADAPREPAGRGRTVRTACRVIALGLSAALLLAAWEPGRWSIAVPALSPWVALSSLAVTHAAPWFVGLGLAVGLVTLVRRRWFCRWICPAGTCADTAAWLGRRAGRRRPRLPAIGRGIAWITLAAACLGYPFLLWLDPLALFSSPFGLAGEPPAAATRWSLLGIALVLLISGIWPGAWCARLCPLGGLQDSLAQGFAGLQHAFRRRTATAPGGWPLSRRLLLGGGLGALAGLAFRTRRSTAAGRLRPPGSLDESRFPGLCIRCGNCARVCPAGILHPHLDPADLASLLTPVVRYQHDYCHETCTRCTQVCPSGAIQRVRAEHKVGSVIGVPQVDMDRCLLGEDRECAICRNHCPFEAIQLKFDEVEYTLVPTVDLARCPGCGACQVACPTQPAKAIVVLPAPRGSVQT